MSNEMSSMLVIGFFILGSAVLGMIPGMKEKMSLENWAVGGRSFGRGLNWFVLAGEIYSAFAFLGASGWAYSKGAPTWYILAYSGLAYLISYYVLPVISRMGQKHGFLTQPDLIGHLYKSKGLGILSAVIGVVFVIPYLQLQLTAIGIIIEACSYGAISRITAMVVAFVLVAAFVYLSGLKGVASTAVVKDIVMAIAIVFFGLYLPIHYFGSIGGMFQVLAEQKPDFLVLPGATGTMDVSWFMTTVLLTAIGFYMWPHLFADSFSAKDPEVLRHNAVYLPLYSLCLMFPMIVGFTALLVVPGLARGDMAFLTLVAQTSPGWVLGLIGGAGALAAMVPAADLLLASSMLISHNIYRPVFGANASDAFVARLSRIVVLVMTMVSLALAILAPQMLVNLLLTGYAGISQFFPVVILGLFWKKATKLGALAGLTVGIGLVFYLVLNKMDPFMGINAGFLALLVNTSVMYVVSSLTYEKAEEKVLAVDAR